jgi:hypothetical protein
MTINFWYWALMVGWAVYACIIGVRNREWFGKFYWGWNGFILLIFVLFVILGLKDFPDPFGTLVKK